MSEYSTDELMGEVQSHLDYGQHMIPTPVCSSIIARLRAADKLCAAATSNVDNCLCNFGGLDEEGRPFGKQPCNLCDPLRKAIAEYEGKEE